MKARRPLLVSVSLVAALILFTWLGHQSDSFYINRWNELADFHGEDPPFSWHSITPTKELVWYQCYKGVQCARLEVPLNYSEPEGRQAAIALTRKPALVSPRLPFYKGPVLLNPGGPGGSGVTLVTLAGGLFSAILGPQFDIVGFDPRGVGASTPRAVFFDSDVERAVYGPGLSIVNISEEGVSRPWATAQLVGKLAAEHDDEYLANINTPNTARDMLSIVQAHGREKLQYWGFSYGSVLGSTFATMFPDKVERLVIDGVMDAEDYYATGWKTNLIDTDKTLDWFFTGCAEAGPDRCPFYSPQPEDIKANLTRVFQKLRRQPIPAKTEHSHGLVDYTLLRVIVFASLYSPYPLWSWLSDALTKLAAGDASSFAILPPLKCDCDTERDRDFDVVADGQTAILCNDGLAVPEALEEANNYFKDLSKISEFADIWARIRLSCVGWPKASKAPSFKGPFVANTSHPLLIVGNTADPVTPLASAKKMSEGFKNSVVLTQDSPGHCSIAAPSLCTQKHIRKYFIDGTLPKPGTVCKPLGSLFPPKVPKPGQQDAEGGYQGQSQRPMGWSEWETSEDFESDLDGQIWDAVEELSLKYPIHIPSSMRPAQLDSLSPSFDLF